MSKEMKVNQITPVLRTSDYSIFKRLIGNRALGARPEKVIKSIQEHGYIFNPIIVNEKYEVIEGQARLEALSRLNFPVDYIIAEGLSLAECITLNSYSTSWSLQDYVETFVSMNNNNYIRLDNLVKSHECSIQTVCNIVGNLYGSAEKSSKYGLRAIKDGNFEFPEEEYRRVDCTLIYIDKFAPILHTVGGSFKNWALALAFCFKLKQIDNDRLYNQVCAKSPEMHPCSTILGALGDLETVYNYKCKTKIYICTEYDKAMCAKNKGYRERWSDPKRRKLNEH